MRHPAATCDETACPRLDVEHDGVGGHARQDVVDNGASHTPQREPNGIGRNIGPERNAGISAGSSSPDSDSMNEVSSA